MPCHRQWLFSAWITVACLPGVLCAQSVEQVLPYVPSKANSLAILNVDAVLNSPRGVTENWAARHEAAYLNGSLTIPPWVKAFVRASQYAPGSAQESWSVAFAPLPADFDLEQIAKKEGTEVQDLKGTPTILSHRYSGYFVELHPGGPANRLLGLMLPASRQDVAAWLSEPHTSPTVSGYLQGVALNAGHQLTLALDTEDMLDPSQIRYRLNGSVAVKDNNLAKTALTIDFQSLRGIQLVVKVTDQITGTIVLDFKRSIGDEGQFVKPVLLELLADAGAEMSDFEQAKVTVSGQTVSMVAPLSDESFRRLLSLVSSPPPSGAAGIAAAKPTTPPQSPDQVNAEDSERYFRAVSKNLEDLENAYKRNTNYNRTAVWHDTYANRIDRLPTAGVHTDLVEFAHATSQRLHALASSLRGTAVDLNALERQIVSRTEYRYRPSTGFEWWWGPPRTVYGPVMTPENTQVIVHSNVEQVRAAQQKAVEAGTGPRDQIWSQIIADYNAVEKKMIDVFGRGFVSE